MTIIEQPTVVGTEPGDRPNTQKVGIGIVVEADPAELTMLMERLRMVLLPPTAPAHAQRPRRGKP